MTEGPIVTIGAVLDAAPFGLYVLDDQLRLRLVNEVAAFAFEPADIGRDFLEVLRRRWPEPRATQIIAMFRRTLETGAPHVEPVWRSPREGEMRTFEWALRRIQLADGTLGVACYFHDVTTIHEAGALVASTAARDAFLVAFADAVRPLPDARDITVVAAELLGHQLGANQVLYAEIDTHAHVGVVTHDWSDGHGPLVTGVQSLADVGPELLATLERGHTVVVDDVRASSGAGPLEVFQRWSLFAFVAVPLVKDDRFVAVLASLSRTPRKWVDSEVSLVEEVAERTWAAVERARAETALRESNKRLQLSLDASNMGAFVWYPSEDRTEPDARMLALFGLPDHGTINLAVALGELVHRDDRARYAAAVTRALDPAGDGALREDIRVTLPDETRWIAITARTEFVEGAPLRLVGMANDVTDRKRVEEALREREERLADSDRKKDEFLAILAHELRNPLAPIRTGVELIRRAGPTSVEAARVTAMMERQVEHMVRLIDDLLDISRFTSGKIRLQREPSELAVLVGAVVDANRAAIAARRIELAVRLPAEPVWLDVDPARFVQIVSNVLHNACKFTNPAGSIAITAATSDGALVLSIADTGIGIAPDALPRIFDLFVQADGSAPRAHDGLGIGLALARRLVEMHGGSIEATSAGTGRGSTFTIRFPLSNTTARDAVAPHGPRVATPRRVIVIDDNRDAADAAAMFVEDLGNDVRVAYDGETGVGLARSFRPEVVLLDLGMQGVDGFETCRRIRAELGSHVFLVALTGWGQEHDKRATALAGFDAHLTKPADPQALERLISDVAG